MSRLTSRLVALVAALALPVLIAAPAHAVGPITTISSGPEDGALVLPGPVQYTFTSDTVGATFECRVDDAPTFTPCVSPASYDLGFGGHTFRVRSVFGGVPGAPVARIWTVRDVACEQAGVVYQQAQANYFDAEGKLGKAKTHLQRVRRHGTQHQISKAKHAVKKAKAKAKAAKQAFDAAAAAQNAICLGT
jgi:hypothetical protein